MEEYNILHYIFLSVPEMISITFLASQLSNTLRERNIFNIVCFYIIIPATLCLMYFVTRTMILNFTLMLFVHSVVIIGYTIILNRYYSDRLVRIIYSIFATLMIMMLLDFVSLIAMKILSIPMIYEIDPAIIPELIIVYICKYVPIILTLRILYKDNIYIET